MHNKERKMIVSTIQLEKERENWEMAVIAWRDVVRALLRKGDLEMNFELEVLDRIMALERGRGRIHECLKFHDRAIRVCTYFQFFIFPFIHNKCITTYYYLNMQLTFIENNFIISSFYMFQV